MQLQSAFLTAEGTEKDGLRRPSSSDGARGQKKKVCFLHGGIIDDIKQGADRF
jgi:hypothetical protein